MNSNSTNRRIVNGLQKFAKRIPLAQAFVTGPTCSVNIKDAKRPKVVMSITLELSLCMSAIGKPAFHLSERVTLIDSIFGGIFMKLVSQDNTNESGLQLASPQDSVGTQ